MLRQELLLAINEGGERASGEGLDEDANKNDKGKAKAKQVLLTPRAPTVMARHSLVRSSRAMDRRLTTLDLGMLSGKTKEVACRAR